DGDRSLAVRSMSSNRYGAIGPASRVTSTSPRTIAAPASATLWWRNRYQASAQKPCPDPCAGSSRARPGPGRGTAGEPDAGRRAISVESDPGIEDAVRDIDEKVGADRHHGDEHNDPLRDRVVGAQRGIHQQFADAGPGKYRLRQRRARQDPRDGHPEDGHDRDQRVAQRVPADDHAAREPLGARGPDALR